MASRMGELHAQAWVDFMKHKDDGSGDVFSWVVKTYPDMAARGRAIDYFTGTDFSLQEACASVMRIVNGRHLHSFALHGSVYGSIASKGEAGVTNEHG